MGNSAPGLALRTDKYMPKSVVVITGATRGIGKGLALRYAQRGASLVLAARSKECLEETKRECVQLGAAGCLVVPTDVTNEQACKYLIKAAVEAFNRIDVLILNAGVSAHFPFSEFADMNIFRRLFDVNFFGYVHCTKHALPHLKRSKGLIVVISSVSGEIGLPLRSAYCSSKFAVTGFFEALRMELEGQVDVTICCPPSVRTEMRRYQLLPECKALDGADVYLKGGKDISNTSETANTAEAAAAETSEGGAQADANEPTADNATEYAEDSNKTDRRMPVDVCVDYILKAADKRARKVMFPLYSYLAVYIRPLLPGIVDPFIKRAAKL
ncbi:hypothetical protein, conserved [Eimeria maxima]|uniref:Ketoreductase domain-containing protein n=1 Tax=Eimeria maxima TaxID=5804 RepID=U6M7G5_EIMMA|nr:hypothetical protein, conserved [Eimeria maxima]CDJ60147.1 hypothetical protein, conserved [Eimeria maxima]